MDWSFCLFPVLKALKALGQKLEGKFKGKSEQIKSVLFFSNTKFIEANPQKQPLNLKQLSLQGKNEDIIMGT